MSRRKAAPKRLRLPDPVYHSELVATFVNHIMKEGKKSVAERIVYGAFDQLKARVKSAKAKDADRNTGLASQSVLDIFDRILSKVKPVVEVKSRRVGGSTYQVPVEVRGARAVALAMRWIIDAARARNERGMVQRLVGELYDAFEGRGGAVKKCEDMHRMAKANQAFAHYRW